jgi:hypothetical protein
LVVTPTVLLSRVKDSHGLSINTMSHISRGKVQIEIIVKNRKLKKLLAREGLNS